MTLKQFLQGCDMTQLTVTGLNVGAGGVLTAGTSMSVITEVENIDFQYRVATEDVRPVTQITENEVRTGMGVSGTLTLLLMKSSASALQTIMYNYSHVRIQCTFGVNIWDGIFIVTGFRTGVSSPGRNSCSMDLGAVAPTDRPQVIVTTA